MEIVRIRNVMAWVALLAASLPVAANDDRAALLRLHADVMAAHRSGDPELLLRAEADDYIVAGKGAITHPSMQERRDRFTRYLASTTFSEYVDAVEPEVTVSEDGSLGWVVVQVRAKGTQQDEAGASSPIEFESAWIELYRREGAGWRRIGNVSNFRP